MVPKLNKHGRRFLLDLRNIYHKRVLVGKDQEKAQSDSQSKNRGGKKTKLNKQVHVLIAYYTMKTYRKPNEQLFSPIDGHSVT